MIKLLHIENIAVIEKADIEFDAGLNVLTGETGAGKSIVVDAFSAVTGGRTSRGIIRTGAEQASVTAVFSGIDGGGWFWDNGVEQDDSGDIYIVRRVTSDGKSVCRVNGAPVSVTGLRELGALLIDIHGQNDGRKLLDEKAHLSYLDSFGGLNDEQTAYSEVYGRLTAKQGELAKLKTQETDKDRRVDMLRYQIEEIERAGVKIGEYDELRKRRELLLNASKLRESADSAFEALYGGEDSAGAVELIGRAQSHIGNAARYSEELGSLGDRLSELQYAAEDISETLRDFRAGLEFEPDELDLAETRLDAIRRVTRKYGGDEEGALRHLENSRAELAGLEDASVSIDKLKSQIKALLTEAAGLAGILSGKRKSAAAQLESRVKSELSRLNMPNVAFIVEFAAVGGKSGLGRDGQDEVCFLMSANAGEKPGKINRIASGGELSRIMLALKSVLSAANEAGTMVFDEIDAGVSGVAAQRVGEKLTELAGRRQILCVTHLPQIAVFADTHFEIRKDVTGGRTFTSVDKLDFNGRTAEIARLIGGDNITETTLTNAAEQINAAESCKKRRS